MQGTKYVGPDVHKATISVATADEGRRGDVRKWARSRTGRMRSASYWRREVGFCCEAGPCGYGLHRELTRSQRPLIVSIFSNAR